MKTVITVSYLLCFQSFPSFMGESYSSLLTDWYINCQNTGLTHTHTQSEVPEVKYLSIRYQFLSTRKWEWGLIYNICNGKDYIYVYQ